MSDPEAATLEAATLEAAIRGAASLAECPRRAGSAKGSAGRGAAALNPSS